MPNPPARQILLSAADRVEGGWCRGAKARDRNGIAVSPLSRSAVCFCPIGAIERTYRDAGVTLTMSQLPSPAMSALIAVTERQTTYRTVLGWNDAPERTKAQVVQALRQAAKDSSGTKGGEAG